MQAPAGGIDGHEVLLFQCAADAVHGGTRQTGKSRQPAQTEPVARLGEQPQDGRHAGEDLNTAAGRLARLSSPRVVPHAPPLPWCQP